MANLTCLNILQVCHMRVLRLGDDGSVLESVDARYEHKAPILFGYTPQSPDRQTFEQFDGCGDQCAFFIESPKSVNSAELTVELCTYDAELQELLLGGSLIEDATPDTIGYLSSTDSTVSANGVAIETWSKAWMHRQRALYEGAPAYYRHAFPLTRWTQDEVSTSNDGFTTITLTGTAEVNSGFGTGYETDPFAADVGESVYGWALTDSIPTGECGYLPVPGS